MALKRRIVHYFKGLVKAPRKIFSIVIVTYSGPLPIVLHTCNAIIQFFLSFFLSIRACEALLSGTVSKVVKKLSNYKMEFKF